MNKYAVYVATNLLATLLEEECTTDEIEMWFGQFGNDADLGRLHNASKQLSDLCWQEIKRRRREEC